MNKLYFFLIVFCFSFQLTAQKIDNNLWGEYQAISDSVLYSSFSFDNAGKVKIHPFGSGDFFVKDDTLIILPDKSFFKFKIKNDTLYGASQWVNKGIWVKKSLTDSSTVNNRKDPIKSAKMAELLHEYFVETRIKIKAMDMFFDEDLKSSYVKTLTKLCDNGLPRGCTELFGMLLIKEAGLVDLRDKKQNRKLDPSLLALANKVIDMGDVDGHYLMGSYYYFCGDKDKAMHHYTIAAEMGSTLANMALMNVNLDQVDQDLQKLPIKVKSKSTIKKKKTDYKKK
jgi:hypothetical protein